MSLIRLLKLMERQRPTEQQMAVLGSFLPDPGNVEVVREIKDRVRVLRYDGLDYVLKQYLPEDSPDKIDFSRRLQRFVNQRMGFPDTTILTSGGGLFTLYDGIGYDLTEYVEVSEPRGSVGSDSDEYFSKIGAFVGRLHNVFAEYERSGIPIPPSGLRIDYEGQTTMEGLLRQYETMGINGPWRGIIRDKIAIADSHHGTASNIDGLPVTLVHGDIHQGNLLIGTDGKVATIIDFIQAGKFYRCYEVMRAAVQTNKSMGNVDLDPRNLRSFLIGYFKECCLEDIELKEMLGLYIYTQANDTSFNRPEIITGGDVEYSLYRYRSLLSLLNGMGNLQSCIDQVGEEMARKNER